MTGSWIWRRLIPGIIWWEPLPDGRSRDRDQSLQDQLCRVVQSCAELWSVHYGAVSQTVLALCTGAL